MSSETGSASYYRRKIAESTQPAQPTADESAARDSLDNATITLTGRDLRHHIINALSSTRLHPRQKDQIADQIISAAGGQTRLDHNRPALMASEAVSLLGGNDGNGKGRG